MAVSFIGEENRSTQGKTPTRNKVTDKFYQIMHRVKIYVFDDWEKVEMCGFPNILTCIVHSTNKVAH